MNSAVNVTSIYGVIPSMCDFKKEKNNYYYERKVLSFFFVIFILPKPNLNFTDMRELDN